MSNVPFDSLAYSERLQEAGVPAPQAAVHAKTLGEVLSRSVVFPHDLVRLENSLMQKFETGQLKFEASQAKLAAEFEKVRSDTNVLKAMVGFLISLVLPILFKLYFA